MVYGGTVRAKPPIDRHAAWNKFMEIFMFHAAHGAANELSFRSLIVRQPLDGDGLRSKHSNACQCSILRLETNVQDS